MRRVLRAEIKAAPDARIAVVCGAWHAPALVPADFPPASRDTDLITKLPRTKVAAAWTPWTAARLSYASGYGAGVSAPGWYQHLFDHLSRPDPDPRDLATSWLVRVARTLREEQLDASTASVVEAARLAETLATVRGPAVGRAERARRRRRDRAVRGVPAPARPGAPTPRGGRGARVGARVGARRPARRRPRPPAAVPAAQADRGRPAGRPRPAAREPAGPLGAAAPPRSSSASPGARPPTPAAPPARSRRAGRWSGGPSWPSTSSRPSIWGTTVAAAAAARAADRAARSADLTELAALVSACLTADLPDGVEAVLDALDARAAVQHDVPALLSTVEPLARTCRYGDVRGVDTARVRTRARRDRRPRVRRPADGVREPRRGGRRGDGHRRSPAPSGGLALLADPELDGAVGRGARGGVRARPRAPAASPAGRPGSCSTPAGSTPTTTAHRMGRRLSLAASAPQAAAWLDGFLAGDAVLLVHDADAARAGRRVGQRARRGGLRGPAAAGAAYVRRLQRARAPHDRRAALAPRRDRAGGATVGERRSTSSRPTRRCTPWPGSSAGRWWRMTEQPEQAADPTPRTG